MPITSVYLSVCLSTRLVSVCPFICIYIVMFCCYFCCFQTEVCCGLSDYEAALRSLKCLILMYILQYVEFDVDVDVVPPLKHQQRTSVSQGGLVGWKGIQL
jgi:hypothetical protein